MTRLPDKQTRIYTLDVLRGLAALSVVFWHWQHFFYVGDKPVSFEVQHQPFFEAFSILYKYGALAVELFFCISGFVFFYLFFQAIAVRKTTAKRFFIDRFSRLYPLYAASFLMVAFLQYLYLRHSDVYFIYQYNDLYHALLNVLMIPAWGFEKGWSYNGPVWSVSVEMFLYIVFFAVCMAGKFRYLLIPGLIVAAWLAYPEHHKLSAGVFSFFSGGLAYLALNKANEVVGRKYACLIAFFAMITAWLAVAFSSTLNTFFLMGLSFPASVMFVASVSYVRPELMKSFGKLGDMSYSSYLLHFPLQIIFAMVMDVLGYSRDVFYNPWMLVMFMAVLIPLSFASHTFFEAPLQRRIRNWFNNKGRQQIPV